MVPLSVTMISLDWHHCVEVVGFRKVGLMLGLMLVVYCVLYGEMN